jgi:hypothetical protein
VSLRDRFPGRLGGYQPDPELLNVDNEPASSYLRGAFLDSIRVFAPDARLDAFANVRLTGPAFESGLFEKHAATIMLRLQNEIDSITDEGDRRDVQVGFQRLGTGSVVIHLMPTAPRVAPAEELPMSAPSLLENALQRILDLHDAFETGNGRLVANRATGELAARARQLVESLDEADAGLDVDLSRSDGTRRQSRLSGVGREYARRFFERTPLTETVILDGYLRSASEAGRIELRRGITRGQRIHEIVDVPADVVKSLEWDKLLRIRVRQTTSTAKAGREPKVENKFLGLATHDGIQSEL